MRRRGIGKRRARPAAVETFVAGTSMSRRRVMVGRELLAIVRARWCSRRAAASCGRDRPPRSATPCRKRGASEHRLAVLVDEAAAVEDQPVVGADHVDVGDVHWWSAARVAISSRRVSSIADPEHGRRELQTSSAPGVGAPLHRAVGAPEVLAHLDREHAEVEAEDEIAERHAAMHLRLSRESARNGAPLVVDAVGRQLLFGHESDRSGRAPPRPRSCSAARRAGSRRRSRTPFRSAAVSAREPLQLRPLTVDEALPLDEVLRRDSRRSPALGKGRPSRAARPSRARRRDNGPHSPKTRRPLN